MYLVTVKVTSYCWNCGLFQSTQTVHYFFVNGDIPKD